MTQCEELTLYQYMDIMFVNGMPMLTGVNDPVHYCACVPLKNRKAPELFNGLDKMLRFYNAHGFYVKLLCADNKFQCIMEKIQDDLDVQMNFANAGEHVPQAERNNRFLGERFRACYHNLPYKAIPRVMIKYMCLNQTASTNIFPNKNGLSDYLSPHTIITGTALDYNKICQVAFGAYVQAYNETTNTQAPRTFDAIYLRPSKN